MLRSGRRALQPVNADVLVRGVNGALALAMSAICNDKTFGGGAGMPLNTPQECTAAIERAFADMIDLCTDPTRLRDFDERFRHFESEVVERARKAALGGAGQSKDLAKALSLPSPVGPPLREQAPRGRDRDPRSNRCGGDYLPAGNENQRGDTRDGRDENRGKGRDDYKGTDDYRGRDACREDRRSDQRGSKGRYDDKCRGGGSRDKREREKSDRSSATSAKPCALFLAESMGIRQSQQLENLL
jgi:hypothetical protein